MLWSSLITVAVVTYGVCWAGLRVLLLYLPVETDQARIFAKDWTTIGAFLLSGWSVVSIIVSPNIPLNAVVTSFIVGGTLLFYSFLRNGREAARAPFRERWRMYLFMWALVCATSGLMA